MSVDTLIKSFNTYELDELRKASKALRQIIKAKAASEGATTMALLEPGMECRTVGLRPKHNDKIVTVLEKKRTRVLCEFEDGRYLVNVANLEIVGDA